MSKKDKVVRYYTSEENRLIKMNVFKEKGKWITKKTIVDFKEPIRLNYMPIEGFDQARITANRRCVNRIESPEIDKRVELDNDLFKGFTINPSLVDKWIKL